MTDYEADKIRRAQHYVARINSMGSNGQSAVRFGYARACATTVYDLLGELLEAYDADSEHGIVGSQVS